MSWVIWIYDDTNNRRGDMLTYELTYVASEDMLRKRFTFVDQIHGQEMYNKEEAATWLVEATSQYLNGESAKVFQGLLESRDAEAFCSLITETFGSDPDLSSIRVAALWTYADGDGLEI